VGISAMVFWVFALGIGSGQAEQKPSITVLVYNYANVSAANLAAGEALATRSYRAAGIEISWIECAVSAQKSQRFRECEQAIGKHWFFLRIITDRMASGIVPGSKGREDALGIALVSHAFVLYERIVDRADAWCLAESAILGHTMAHELGHLLLGDYSHTASGVMQPLVHRQDLKLESGQFLFEPNRQPNCDARLRGE